ncbi:MAG: NADPH-dependent F420 reductase [Bryobacteraceae bacterium]
MMQTIGIIGTGSIGGAVARLAIAAGLDVIVSNSRGPETLAGLVGELGRHVRAATPEEAAQASDLVAVATPLKAYDKLPVEALKGKIVIDTMNYYPVREGQMPVLDAAQMTSSELVQQHLKGAKVVKGMHNQDAPHLFINALPLDKSNRTTLPIAGDDPEATRAVTNFMDAIGYNAVDIGPLSESWRIEPGTPIYVWPYAPKVPDELNGAEAERWYSTTPGAPVSLSQAKDLVAKAVRQFPVGGFPKDLPAVWIAIQSKRQNSK